MQKIHALIHRLHNPDFGILLVRIVLGLAFMHAGWFKITHVDMIVGGFAMMGIPAVLAYFVTYAEFVCGLLMIIGIFVRYAGIVLASIMVVAIAKVHFPNGYGMMNGVLEGKGGGYEYVLALLLLSVAMVTFGAGAYSLARVLKK